MDSGDQGEDPGMARNPEWIDLMSGSPHVNTVPGCQKPTSCYARKGYLCASCHAAVSFSNPVDRASVIVRIEMTASRRRRLGDMARRAGMSADALASGLLSTLIDNDAAAHGETEFVSGEGSGCGGGSAITLAATKKKTG